MTRLATLFLLGFLGVVVVSAQTPTPDWPAVGGDIGGMKYSPLDEITPANVTKLTQAWSYNGGGVPIIIDNVMYFASGGSIVAVKADSGTEVWKFQLNQAAPGAPVRRGLTYWPGDA